MAEKVSDLRKRGLWVLKPCTRRLIGLLAHQDPQLRSETAAALGHIGDPESLPFLIEALIKEKQDEQVPLSLAEIGDQTALEPLLEAFGQADRYARPNIALALGAFRDPRVITALGSGLSDPDPNVRFNCVTGLGKLKDPASVPALQACLGESNEWIFMNVVEVLARIGDHRSTNPMIVFYLKEPNERKRASLITALGWLKDLTSLPTISKALRDPDDRVKSNAIEAIRRLELPKDKVMSLLQPFMKHSDNRVRGNAIIAVSTLGGMDPAPILEAMRDDPNKWIRATLGYILSVIDHARALSFVVDLLKDDDGDVRKNAARALANRARDGETELLIRLLNDPAPFVRLQAVLTLGRIQSVPSVDSLIRLFARERNFKIRSAIVAAFGSIGDQGAVPLLTQALNDLDSRVRANAVESLEKILGETSTEYLKEKLNDPDNRTRANAAKALFRNGETSVLAHLETMIVDKETSTRISGVYALGQIGLALKELERSPLFNSLKTSLGSVEIKDQGKILENQKKSEAVAASTPAKPIPQSKEALREYFLEQFRGNHFKEALEGVMVFLQHFPSDFSANLFAGNLNFQLSRFDEAIRFFKIAVEIDPFHVQAYSNCAIACYKTGRIQESIHYFKQALKIQPELSNLRFNLANLLLKENNWEEAIAQYEEGLRYQKAPPRILANLGFACQKTGQYEKAIQHYEAAMTADPTEAGVYYNLAMILFRQGKKDKAKAILLAAIKNVPVGSAGLKTIREFLERIKG